MVHFGGHVGSVRWQSPYALGRLGAGLGGFGVMLGHVGAVRWRGPYALGRPGAGLGGFGDFGGVVLTAVVREEPHPHPKLGIEVSQASR